MPIDNSEVQMWKERIKNGQRFQLKLARSNEWERYKKYYRHSFRDGSIPVNLVFSVLRSMVPQVYFRNPKVSVCPRGYSDPMIELSARVVEQLDNWLLRELSTKGQLKQMVQDAFLCGTASGFVGFDALEYGKDSNRLEFEVSKKEGMPWFLRSRPEDVVYPWGATSKDSLEWVAFRVFRKLEDVKNDPKYKGNTSDLRGTDTPRRTYPEGAVEVDPADHSLEDKDAQWVEIWQIHDARTKKVMALTMEHDKFLRNDDDDMQIEGLPVETVVFNPDPDYIYGIPDARIIEPQLLELLDIRTQSMKHRRVNLVRTLGKRGILKQEEIEKLTSAEVQPYIEVDTDVDIKAAVTNWNPGVSGILQDLALQGEQAQGDVRESVGFSRVSQGQYQGKTHISAKETENVARALNIRLDERRDIMADTLINIVRKWNQYIFTHWKSDQVAKIIGPNGASYWIKFNGPQIKGEYSYDIEMQDATPLTSEVKLQKAVEAARAWSEMNAGAVKAGMPVPLEIQKAVFSNIEGIDVDRLMAQLKAVNQGAQAAVAEASSGGAPGSSPQTAVPMGGGQ